MLIATYVDGTGTVVDFFESGTLRVYDDASGSWTETVRAPLEGIDQSLPLTELKERFVAALDGLGADCKVFLARETRGILRVFLEELEFRVWKSRGALLAQLDDARRQEREAVAEQEALDAALPKPDPVGEPAEGAFRIDLIRLLSEDTCHVSRDLMIPFLETVPFARLEVVCDHVPRWFPAELPDLGIEALVPEDAFPGDPMNVVLVPRTGDRTVPVGRRPGKQGCSCGG